MGWIIFNLNLALAMADVTGLVTFIFNLTPPGTESTRAWDRSTFAFGSWDRSGSSTQGKIPRFPGRFHVSLDASPKSRLSSRLIPCRMPGLHPWMRTICIIVNRKRWYKRQLSNPLTRIFDSNSSNPSQDLWKLVKPKSRF